MKNYLIACSFIFTCVNVSAQYKYDNQNFTTVYFDDLCQSLKNNPGYLLLDVRSQGEYNDTSQYSGSNVGRLQNAKNIDLKDLNIRLGEIAAYKDKPVFVYCSHSQRSRRASKLLSDSGFTKIFNVNGGLTTFHRENLDTKGCPHTHFETQVNYKLVTAAEVDKRNYYIVDLRDESVFNGTSSNEGLIARGKIAGAINMPWKNFKDHWYKVPVKKNILLVDDYGNESPLAAAYLNQKGVKKISVLFKGMDELAQYRDKKGLPSKIWEYATTYHFITPTEFDVYLKTKPQVTIVDVRSKEEFKNQHKEDFKNTGNISNAINIPADEIENTSNFPMEKNANIILYALSNNNAFEAAKALQAKGFDNITVLLGGVFSLRWQAANLKDKSHLKDWVVNVPQENM